MELKRLHDMLNAVANGSISVDDALSQLQSLPFEDVGFAKVDLHRNLRQGLPEVIFCPGKQVEQILAIASTLLQHHPLVLATRADPATAAKIVELDPRVEYITSARILYWGAIPAVYPSLPTVAVVTAGTADLPAADEAAFVLSSLAVPVVRVNDVGVAGIHRLLSTLAPIRNAAAVIVVAGMDGALPSVVAGLVAGPVIAVPTSVGYGAAFEGLAALLTMLNSCAAGVTVVNIDNGFGAAVAAHRLLHSRSRTTAAQS